MAYKLMIRPEAKTDLLDAFRWYQDQKHGLGYDFKLCVDEVMSKIQGNPLAYKTVFQEIRRVIIKRFPFGVFFIFDNHQIVVLAVLHARRDPSNWKKRI